MNGCNSRKYINVIINFLIFLSIFAKKCNGDCKIAEIIQGKWYSRETTSTDVDVTTDITSTEMIGSEKKKWLCVDMKVEYRINHTLLFKDTRSECYFCVKLLVRTVNVLEKMEGTCLSPDSYRRNISVDSMCAGLTANTEQTLVTMFNENNVPVNCRSSLEGVWQFAYKNQFTLTGECNKPDALIKSCQEAGTQFLITNQKFNITYKQCEGMSGTKDAVVEYKCLGDWFVEKNHFFAVANTKESRIEEKYRCFLKNRDDDLYIGVSITPTCNTLKTVENSPERLRITPVKTEVVEPGCRLPENFTGEWVNTANVDADVAINSTHIVETWYPDEGRYRRTIYVCKENKDSRYMMARLTVDGCQKDYICFDFVSRHHSVIRYRKGQAVINDNFHTVCSFVQFPNSEEWKYDLFLLKNPVAVRCPVAGKYRFKQRGDIPFVTRILGGITQSPRPEIYCHENISDISICDTEQKEIAIDENYCLSLDHRARPLDIYSDPDYRLKCIGYWKENLKSYLITYDELDAFTKYRCWLYQRSDLNKLLMSQAIGPFCDLRQDVTSWNHTEGAAVAIEMQEYERERDDCPMHFDDGANPWAETEVFIQILEPSEYKSGLPYFAANRWIILAPTLFVLTIK